MAQVTGIGGVFFKAQRPERMREWYREHLGLDVAGEMGCSFFWRDDRRPARRGRTVWSVFDAQSDYFAPSTSPLMINYRVDDLDALLERLRSAGVHVLDRVDEYEYGRFAWIIDPEGNKIELWEPRGEDPQSV